ncbi:putative peptidylarginine deiminase [Schizothecium vesticola]|uniref:Peptidylarginine deiminase n=1 Tax=Schizothecium vesticola TaxID=314040 RepID=A0AA40EL10_9PEZI|nr:putative peptidylarginine deiminase [Schizothecium vesticola]
MSVSLRRLLHLLPSLSSLGSSLEDCSSITLCPRILADTNRDGLVNDLDRDDRRNWTLDRGAIFLPNIGDTAGRCPVVDLAGDPLSNAELSQCHDASGDRLLSPRFAAPLSTSPIPDISPDAIGHIYADSDRVRIFWQHGGVGANITDHFSSLSDEWALVDRQLTFNATSLRNGVTLALDGRELVTDSHTWDGQVRVFFEIEARNETARDFVILKQAPVLLHHHLQRPEAVLSTAPGNNNNPGSTWQTYFIQQLRDTLGVGTNLTLFHQDVDIWTQDFFEPAYASMPGPRGPITLRILLRSAQSTRLAGRQVFTQLRGPGIGGFQPALGSGFGYEEINSGGNIETIPPYTSRVGKVWHNGRAITGKHFGKLPAEAMVQFLQSQGDGGQSPLFLETGWLAVGHVDEFVQFLPSPSETMAPGLGFTIAVADTRSALELLHKVQAAGHGDIPAMSYDGDITPDERTLFLDAEFVLNTTISDLLLDDKLLSINSYAQEHIDDNLAILLKEIPLRDEDILRVPVLFRDVTFSLPATPDGLPPGLDQVKPGGRKVMSLFPNAVNSLVLEKRCIAPKLWGPVIDGKDVLAQAVLDVYAKVNMSVAFIDNYMSHHARGGEVHCGTNTLREMERWWL